MQNSPLLNHRKWKGKLYVKSKVNLRSRRQLTDAYTPGVALAVREIAGKKESVYDLTVKNNSVAVVTDGSAVLGLGNVGPYAAIPVMEGKCAIFSQFAGINAFPICLDTQDTEEIIETVRMIAPVFSGINLEDISAPRCFEIEEKLQSILDIPVMHDDQHATAIVVLAGLLNAAKALGKDLRKCKTVINGAGAAGSAIAGLLHKYGITDLLIADSRGIISESRTDLDKYKKKLAGITNRKNIQGSLADAVIGADILIGVSVKGIFTENIIRMMSPQKIVFALANPDPELNAIDAQKREVTVYANGRSDCRNQINNALVFPGFFKGLIKNKIKKITPDMKIKAAVALSSLVASPSVKRIIPSIFNREIVDVIARSLDIMGK